MSDAVSGFLDFSDFGSDRAAQEYIVKQVLNRISSVTLVTVTGVTNNGGVTPVGFVNFQPMVHQVSPDGTPTPHGEINQLPYFRLQGGANAVILDPQVGDIGIGLFCSRDISAVKRQKAPAAPGSRRRYDWADGLYVGGVLNGVPTQYVRFSTTGIDLVTPNNFTVTAANMTIDASGNLSMKGEVTAKAGASHVNLSTHHTSNVQTGVGTSGAPVPGT